MNDINPFKSYYHKNIINWSYKDIVLISVFLFLIQFVYGIILGVVGVLFLKDKSNLLIYVNSTFFILYFFFFIWLIFYKYKISAESLKLVKNKHNFKNIFIGIIFGLVFQTLFYIFSSIYPNLFSDDYLKYFDLNLVRPFTLIISALTLIFLVPFIEEVFFRGILFQKLKGSFSLWIALTIQSFFFTLTHFQYFSSIYIIFIFILGIVAGIIYHWTNSLKTAVYFHITYNLVWFVWLTYYLKDQGEI